MTIHTLVPLPRLVASGGPVSRALRVMTEADSELARIRALRRAIADRIEADLALLDALGGDPDLEENGDDEPSLGSLHCTARSDSQWHWSAGGTDDCEYGDDNGVADDAGAQEQARRYVLMGGDLAVACGFAGGRL